MAVFRPAISSKVKTDNHDPPQDWAHQHDEGRLRPLRSRTRVNRHDRDGKL